MLKHTKAFAAAGVVVLAGSSAAYATTTTTATDDVVKACYLNGVGTLRYAPSGNCLALLETPISWSKAGVPGPTGPEGPTGPAGPPGTSRAAEAEQPVNGIEITDGLAEPVLSMALPAGTWVVNASGTVANAGGDSHVTCHLHSTQEGILSGSHRVDLPPDSYDVIALTGVVTHTAGATVRAMCSSGVVGEQFAYQWDMTAVEAGSVLP